MLVLQYWCIAQAYILEAICFKSCLVLFYPVFFSPLSTAITSLGDERANLSALHTFIRFGLFWFYLFPLSPSVWVGLRLLQILMTLTT